MQKSDHGWWTHWGFVAALALLSMLPFLAYPFPPMVDVLGHMARYAIQLNYGEDPVLSRFYDYDFRLMGNVGVDLLVELFGRKLGYESIVKWVVVVTPAIMIVGLAWVSKALLGRISATLPFAALLAFNFAYLFGFVNFALSAAMALNAFALWIVLGKAGKSLLRAVLFVPLGIVIYLCHLYGLGLLGLLVFGYEAFGRAGAGARRDLPSLLAAGLRTAPLWPPILHTLLWRSSMDGGETKQIFSIDRKLTALATVLMDSNLLLDILLLAPLVVLIVQAARKDDFRFQTQMLWIIAPLALAFVLMPGTVFGSAFADTRLAAYVLALLMLAIVPAERHAMVAAFGGALFLCRVATVSWGAQDNYQAIEDNRAIVDAIPHGASLLQLNGNVCPTWTHSRLKLLGSFHIIRNHGFSNSMWEMGGANPLRITYDVPRIYRGNSVMVGTAWGCGPAARQRLDHLFANFPRDKFDYVLMIEPPRGFVGDDTVRKIASTPQADLYEVTN